MRVDAVERNRQYEVGLRYLMRGYGAPVAAFYNKFSPRSAVNVYKDIESPACATQGGVTQINSCPRYRQEAPLFGMGLEIRIDGAPSGFRHGAGVMFKVL